ncbi:MAG: A/G-specific adenine glycosylase [Gammaproteobacteria bacterium]|nr:A/G-specific adenine glycosylase [Gammaproteobacteria bacterium]MCP5195298.1 A/G-specific adenine glycosylase [Gammaproteobacteria bacterium]
MNPIEFSQRVLDWFDIHGRKQLPWKENPTPYRVWVSEIMLQQTQVTTVIPYYERFMARFPDIRVLADAELDEVLQLWAGLGYYARARHLHQAARILCARAENQLPLDMAVLQELPGIGRSTAGAILALASGQRQPILDGNVKRLLARFAAVEGWPGQSRVQATLWELAERYTPNARVADYTQAVMDLGAMICKPHQPCCEACPLIEHCAAYAQGRQVDLPTPKPRRELPVRTTQMLLLRAENGAVLLERRPPIGLWGGLWSFPECPMNADAATWCQERLGLMVMVGPPWEVIRHSFSHFHLDITPVPVTVTGYSQAVMEGERFIWHRDRHAVIGGMATPIHRLLVRRLKSAPDTQQLTIDL